MTDILNAEHVAWCRNHFSLIAEGGVWGVPRSGLMFTRRGETLVLTAAMPHMEAMPITEAELREQQEHEYQSIKRHFEAAGITVTRTEEER